MYFPLAAGPSGDASLQPLDDSRRRFLRSPVLCLVSASSLLLCLLGVLLNVNTRRSRHGMSQDVDAGSVIAFATRSGSSGSWLILIGLIVFAAVLAYAVGHLIIARVAKALMTSLDKYFLGIDVTMDHVEASLWQGRFKAFNVKLENPPDFEQSCSFLTMEEASFQMDIYKFLKSFGQIVEIKDMVVKRSTAYAQYQKGTWNAQVILDNLKENLGNLTSYIPKAGNKKAKKRILILHELDFKGLTVQFRTDMLGKKIEPLPMKMMDVHYDDFQAQDKMQMRAGLGKLLAGTLAQSTYRSACRVTSASIEAAKHKIEVSVDSAKQAKEAAKHKIEVSVDSAKQAKEAAKHKIEVSVDSAKQAKEAAKHKIEASVGSAKQAVTSTTEAAKQSVDSAKQAVTSTASSAMTMAGSVNKAASKKFGALGKAADSITHKVSNVMQSPKTSKVHPAVDDEA